MTAFMMWAMPHAWIIRRIPLRTPAATARERWCPA
jgi:hypothetical protein